jgi:hypothetical protein
MSPTSISWHTYLPISSKRIPACSRICTEDLKTRTALLLETFLIHAHSAAPSRRRNWYASRAARSQLTVTVTWRMTNTTWFPGLFRFFYLPREIPGRVYHLGLSLTRSCRLVTNKDWSRSSPVAVTCRKAYLVQSSHSESTTSQSRRTPTASPAC